MYSKGASDVIYRWGELHSLNGGAWSQLLPLKRFTPLFVVKQISNVTLQNSEYYSLRFTTNWAIRLNSRTCVHRCSIAG